MRGLSLAERACRRLFGRNGSITAACSMSSELQNSAQAQLPMPSSSAPTSAADLRGDFSGAWHAQPQQQFGSSWNPTTAALHSAAATTARAFSSEAEHLQRSLRQLKGMSLSQRQERVNDVMGLAELLPDRSAGCPFASPTAASRSYSTAVTEPAFASEREYHHIADQTLDHLLEDFEDIVDRNNIETADIEYGQGVLTLKFEDHGTYVLNKQTPNLQIWLSSPVSGPVRYDYMDGKWIYRHDGHVLHDRLEQELSELLHPDTGRVHLTR